jgi:CRP/FNR family cyclic AMP-dependent transcriptional regulator
MNINLCNLMPGYISKRLIRRHYEAGSPIIMAGLDNKHVYFLVEGNAEASIQNSNGALATVYLYTPNSMFGEIEQFYEGIKPVSIIALTPCIIDVLYRDDFIEWLQNDFESIKALICNIAQKLVHNSELIEEISLLSVRERILRCIAIYQHQNMLDRLTKKQLSIHANVPIRSVNRAIAECVQQGLLIYQDKHFHILNQLAIMDYLHASLG